MDHIERHDVPYIYDLTDAWGSEVYSKLSWFKLWRIKEAQILVVGCGALGNEVLKNLALFGVEHFTVVDFDRIETSNLSRSVLFTLDDAHSHRRKVDAITDSLKRINPRIEVESIEGDIAHALGLGRLREMDVAISCVDNRFARYCLNRMCMRVDVPMVDGGIDGLEGTARIFKRGHNCYACNLPQERIQELMQRHSCSSVIHKNEAQGRAATTPIIASIIGAVEAQEAIKLIHHEELKQGLFTSLLGKMFYWEGQHLSSRIVEFVAYDQDCPSHEDWTPTSKAKIDVQTQTLESTFKILHDLLTPNEGEELNICLRDYSFVDFIEDRLSGETHRVMRPSFLVEEFLDSDETLKAKPLNSFLLHEYPVLNDITFPYPKLTLSALGIPSRDILHVQTLDSIGNVKKDHFVEIGESF